MFRKTENRDERSEIRALPYVTKDLRELHKNEQRAQVGKAPTIFKKPNNWVLLTLGVFMWYNLALIILF